MRLEGFRALCWCLPAFNITLASLQHTQPEAQALTFVRKTIQLGPVQLDGFMLPDGHFRQGLGCTGRAIGRGHQRVSRIVSALLAGGANPLSRNESRGFLLPAAAGVDPLRCSESQRFPQATAAGSLDPMITVMGRPEKLLTLELAQKVWSYEARYAVRDAENTPNADPQLILQAAASQEMAWQLIDMLAGVSLERSYQEAFGVQDSRNQEDRLLDFFIDWNIGPYRVLFDREFQIQFKRVTGYDINSPNKCVKFIIANFFYNRLPAQVYEALMDLNPEGESGYRKHKHHQLLTDKAKLEVALPIISSLKAFMVQAPSGDVRFVNEAMDKLHPTQRGQRKKTSQARHAQMSWC